MIHRTIANYLMWRAARASSIFLHDIVRTRALQYSKIQTGKQTYEPRWKECVSMAAYYLPVATGALYVRTFFSQNSKEIASEMIHSIRSEFEKTLKAVPWMDEMTRAAALHKMENMDNHIGYPSELLDDKKLIEFHEDLSDVNEHEYLKSVFSLNRFKLKTVTKKFRESVNKTEWISHSNVAIANAYYGFLENSIRK